MRHALDDPKVGEALLALASLLGAAPTLARLGAMAGKPWTAAWGSPRRLALSTAGALEWVGGELLRRILPEGAPPVPEVTTRTPRRASDPQETVDLGGRPSARTRARGAR